MKLSYDEKIELMSSLNWDSEVDFISYETFTSFKIRWSKTDALLKLDFKNDINKIAYDMLSC